MRSHRACLRLLGSALGLRGRGYGGRVILWRAVGVPLLMAHRRAVHHTRGEVPRRTWRTCRTRYAIRLGRRVRWAVRGGLSTGADSVHLTSLQWWGGTWHTIWDRIARRGLRTNGGRNLTGSLRLKLALGLILLRDNG